MPTKPPPRKLFVVLDAEGEPIQAFVKQRDALRAGVSSTRPGGVTVCVYSLADDPESALLLLRG